MPLSEDILVLVHSRKKEVSISKIHMYSLDLELPHSLEPTSSVRLHKVQYSVLVIQSPHLVVQMRPLSLQLSITPFSSISLELVVRLDLLKLQLQLHLSDQLVLFLVSNLLLVSVLELYYLMLVVVPLMSQSQEQMEMSISSISLV